MTKAVSESWPRSSGVLLHVTSLPGHYGIGDLGPAAYRFVDWLVETKQSVWNILPLHPTGYGNSPYSTLSVFAGNPLLISLDLLVEDGWLTLNDLEDSPVFPNDYVDYGPVIAYHNALLSKAFEHFIHINDSLQQTFQLWCAEQYYWLDDFALYMTLKDLHEGRPFSEWKREESEKNTLVLDTIRKDHAQIIEQHRFIQWLFFRQWHNLKSYANERGIRIMGDMPIYTALDCSEVWGRPHLFEVDEGHPTVTGGMPPDYFSPTGQRWGNPLFRWESHQKENYHWWTERFRSSLELYDLCRIDHFRGFVEYWEIPAGEVTAGNGRWVSGPGRDLFNVVRAALPTLNIVAEDVGGEINQEVASLLDDNHMPGMIILQFAWGSLENLYIPHNNQLNRIIYTGTHDNDTSVGWWTGNNVGDSEKQHLSEYIGVSIDNVKDPNWELTRLAMISPAHTCIIPMQDVLGLGAKHRMNTPGWPDNNWTWRITYNALEHPAKQRLAQMTMMYGRCQGLKPRI